VGGAAGGGLARLGRGAGDGRCAGGCAVPGGAAADRGRRADPGAGRAPGRRDHRGGAPDRLGPPGGNGLSGNPEGGNPEVCQDRGMDPLTPNTDLYNVTYQAHDYQGMPYRYLGRSGLQGPAIGLGTWKFGFPDTGDGARIDPEGAAAIMDRACELGVMFWDTANRYNAASGNSERLIGRWLADNPQRRRDVVLATKTHGGMDGWTPNHAGLSRLQIIESVKASLERLQTDYLDVLWFHRFDENVPLEESLETVEDLVSQGTVRYLAVSNFSAAQLGECLRISESLSRRTRPIAVQNRFDPLNGESLPGVLDL